MHRHPEAGTWSRGDIAGRHDVAVHTTAITIASRRGLLRASLLPKRTCYYFGQATASRNGLTQVGRQRAPLRRNQLWQYHVFAGRTLKYAADTLKEDKDVVVAVYLASAAADVAAVTAAAVVAVPSAVVATA